MRGDKFKDKKSNVVSYYRSLGEYGGMEKKEVDLRCMAGQGLGVA